MMGKTEQEIPARGRRAPARLEVHADGGEVFVYGTGAVAHPCWPEEEAARMLLSHAGLLQACEALMERWGRMDPEDIGCGRSLAASGLMESIRDAVALAKGEAAP